MKKILLATLLLCASVLAVAKPQITAETNFRESAEKAYLAHQYESAFKQYQRFAKLGDGQSMYNLAFMTRHGQGTKQSNSKALEYYKKASKLNFPLANMALADIYALGELGVTADMAQAKYYLEQASKQGVINAQLELANLAFSEGQDQQALAILKPLLDIQHFDALYLKAIYDLGYGLQQQHYASVTQSVKTLEHLAKQGHTQSMMAVANMLVNGDVIPQDLKMARQLYQILAQHQVPTAQERLNAIDAILTNPQP